MEAEVETPEYFFDHYEMPNRIFNKDRGWEIYPKGIYDILIMLRDEYDDTSSIYFENGIGRYKGDIEDMDDTGFIHDDARIEFLKEHLKWIWKAQMKALMFLDITCGHLWIIGLCLMLSRISMDLYMLGRGKMD